MIVNNVEATKNETIAMIKRIVAVNKKTMEGVLFYDTTSGIMHGWGFCRGVYNTACLLSRPARYREAYYFKCTPSGKYNETQVLF